jgi:glycosyltransferase involved in cell wall biosynthesis
MTSEAPPARPRREDVPERRAGCLRPHAARARLALFCCRRELAGGVARAFIRLASGFAGRDVDAALVVTGSISRKPDGPDQRVVVHEFNCGCQVVSTDCPSGPAEILGNGAYGRLAPVGDHLCLADAMLAAVAEEADRERLIASAHDFHGDMCTDRYLAALGVSSDPAPPK